VHKDLYKILLRKSFTPQQYIIEVESGHIHFLVVLIS
jgi:hypothetical protein